jgi:hypothetical protein
VNVTFGYPA